MLKNAFGVDGDDIVFYIGRSMKAYPKRIPFAEPVRLTGGLTKAFACLERGTLSGNGPYTKEVEKLLEQRLQAPARLVTSATHALEMMAISLGLQPGDEVICPSYTFVSTANAFALHGARIRFADNDSYGNLSLSEVERLWTPRTRAVLAVDYAGNSPDYDALIDFCRAKKVALFEDAAQGIGATYKGRPLGTLGDAACFSFHETKNVGCGEGGAFISKQPALMERAEILREKGTDRSRFFQGLVDKYTWVDVGSSYVLSELNAALLVPQLERFDEISQRRSAQWERYRQELDPVLARFGLERLQLSRHNSPNHHIFGVFLKSFEMRSDFIRGMNERNVATPFHYVALHSSPAGRRFAAGDSGPLPECERFSSCLARLPLFYNLSDDDQSRVIESTVEVIKELMA